MYRACVEVYRVQTPLSLVRVEVGGGLGYVVAGIGKAPELRSEDGVTVIPGWTFDIVVRNRRGLVRSAAWIEP